MKLQVDEFSNLLKRGADVLDTRSVEDFKAGFIPSAINIPLNRVKDWGSLLFKKGDPILLITETGQQEEAAKVLTTAGFSNIAGYLEGGFTAWQNAGKTTDMIIDVEPDELMMDIPFDCNLVVVDVRNPIEYAEGHLKNAMNFPLSEISDPLKIARFNDNDNIYLHSGSGTRSVIAASVLKKHGLHNLRNVVGGWNSVKEEPKAAIVKEPEVLN